VEIDERKRGKQGEPDAENGEYPNGKIERPTD